MVFYPALYPSRTLFTPPSTCHTVSFSYHSCLVCAFLKLNPLRPQVSLVYLTHPTRSWVFLSLFWVFKTGFLCVSVLAVLELALYTRLALNSKRSDCLHLRSAGIKSVRQHHRTMNYLRARTMSILFKVDVDNRNYINSYDLHNYQSIIL